MRLLGQKKSRDQLSSADIIIIPAQQTYHDENEPDIKQIHNSRIKQSRANNMLVDFEGHDIFVCACYHRLYIYSSYNVVFHQSRRVSLNYDLPQTSSGWYFIEASVIVIPIEVTNYRTLFNTFES